MSVGQILDAAYWVYRRSFTTYLALSVLFVLPTLLAGLVARRGLLIVLLPEGQTDFGLASLASLAGWAAMLFSANLALALGGGAMARVLAAERVEGRELSAIEAVAELRGRFGRLVSLAAVMTVALAIGALVIFPAVLMAIWYAVATPVVALEGISARFALRRSHRLIAGNGGRVLWAQMGVLLACGIVIGAVSGLGLALSRYVLPEAPAVQALARYAAALAGPVLVAPLLALSGALMYVDLRIRKEGLDLQRLIPRYGRATEAPVAETGRG